MASPDPCLPTLDPLKLVREGTEQNDRFVAALDPSYAPVNGREPAHSMLFARAYAAYLKYFELDNSENGDWQAFFASDVSVLLASASTQDVDRFRTVIQSCYDALIDLDNAADDDLIRYNLSFVFAAVGTLADQLDNLVKSLPKEIGLKATVTNLIASRLQKPLERIVRYYLADQAASPDNLVTTSLGAPYADHDLQILGYEPYAFSEVMARGLSASWTKGASWSDHVASLTPDASVFGSGTVFERGKSIATHNLFTGAVDQFLKVYARVVVDAAAALEDTLESFDSHEPHYALFLAFLQLFEYAREEMNGLTARHLDFYYRDVLQLQEQAAQPSRAHVLLELAKNVASYEMAEGTALKAGKDDTGVPIEFNIAESLVANKASVEKVMNIYRADEAVYVSTEARSDEASWFPFQTDDAIATLGFSIASHYLYLAEGSRTITLTATINNYSGPIGIDITEHLSCRLTCEEGWLDKEVSRAEIINATTLEVEIVLIGDDPSIVAFDAVVHESAYNVQLPIVEVFLKPATGMASQYAALEDIRLESIKVRVDVVGVRTLTVSNDNGSIDTSKPFQPFGSQPVKGSSLIVGCQEAFMKQGAMACELQLLWRNRPSSMTFDATSKTFTDILKGVGGAKRIGKGGARSKPSIDPYAANVKLSYLTNAAWKTEDSSLDIITETAETLTLHSTSGINDVVPVFNAADENNILYASPFGLDATTGFIKLSLNASLGHAEYPLTLADDVLKRIDDDTYPLTEPPYTPELESITMDYSAEQVIDVVAGEADFKGRQARFYHVTSLGLAERHEQLATTDDPSVYLMPQLRHIFSIDTTDSLTTATTKGELYIGLKGAVVPQLVSLLFQVEDGTADPLVDRGKNQFIHWSYLSENNWVAFDSDEVSDRTSELLASGIVQVTLPEEATNADTWLAGDLTWIRAVVFDLTNAVCKLVGIHAQAVESVFVDKGNDEELLAEPLPAGTIAKLLMPTSSVKSIKQPYETYGGKTAEASDAFRTRVSERLRHKDRAVTLWDYEHLVLQAFPSVHRVKCLNHTRFEPVEGAPTIYHEMSPGHVTVVCIPEVSESSTSDPLKPYTSLRVLEEIKAFLTKRMTCFATLHVRNPIYEEVKVSCDVILREGSDPTYYENKLREAVTQFLSPWAYDMAKRPTFGGKMYASSIINFIEEQPYVDYLVDFELIHTDADGVVHNSKVSVEGSKAVSILVSVDADLHAINVVDAASVEEPSEPCGCSS